MLVIAVVVADVKAAAAVAICAAVVALPVAVMNVWSAVRSVVMLVPSDAVALAILTFVALTPTMVVPLYSEACVAS